MIATEVSTACLNTLCIVQLGNKENKIRQLRYIVGNFAASFSVLIILDTYGKSGSQIVSQNNTEKLPTSMRNCLKTLKAMIVTVGQFG